MVIPRCSAQHTAHATTLRFGAPVTLDSVRWLIDEIQHARTYLRHDRVTIEFHSHGGDSEGLEHWLAFSETLTARRGFTLATRAVGSTSSAAAIMLSQGTIGARSAVPTARLLYHGARIINATGDVWTADRLHTHHEEVAATTARVLEQMVLHRLRDAGAHKTTRRAPATTHTELLARYTALFSRDTQITPTEACEHGLIDFVADY